MTPIEIATALRIITDEAGPKAYASIIVSSDRSEGCYVSLSPNGMLDEQRITATAPTFESAIQALRDGWAASRSQTDKNTIRKMALAIIEITGDLGGCKDAALRGAGFHQRQIESMGSLACAEATRLAAGGPFTIIPTIGANARRAA